MRNLQLMKRPLLAVAAVLSLAGAAHAATDIFLKIDGIPGESVAKGHQNEIDVLSWSWGVTPREEARAGRRGCVQDISIAKLVDSASPPLFAAAAVGAQIPKAVLTVRRGVESPQEYLKLELNQVLVSSVQQSGAGGGGGVVEQITLKAATVIVSYSPQKADGSLGTAITASVSGGC